MTTMLLLMELERFRTIIVRRLGLFFEDGKREFLTEVLRRRLKATRQTGEKYLAFLEKHSPHDELAALATELTVPETYFFRYNDQFRAFAELCLPERMSVRKSHRKLSLLSAGCASGEEPYSMAIRVRERIDPAWKVAIRAFDVNPVMLEKAAIARYSSWALRETSPSIQRRWFRQDGGDAVLDQSVRAAVHFEERNLVDSNQDLWQPDVYDVIFCRNVIMYFTPDNAEKIITRMTRSLAPGGYLFLGHAETLRGYSNNFELCHTHEAFYYRRKEKLGVSLSRAELLEARQAQPCTFPAAVTFNPEETWIDTIRRSSNRTGTPAGKSPPHHANPALQDPVPDTPRPHLELGLVFDLLQKERFSDALKRIEALPIESADDPDVLLILAVVLTHSGRLTEAEDVCRRLLEVDGLNAGAHYVLALCREGALDCRGAIDQDQVAAYLDPSFAMPRLHLGLMARKGDDREAARRELAQATVLLQGENTLRLLLFGGGFSREALITLCRTEQNACGGKS